MLSSVIAIGAVRTTESVAVPAAGAAPPPGTVVTPSNVADTDVTRYVR